MHRFIRQNFDFSQDKLVITDRRLIHQIKNVLRLEEGDTIQLCDGNKQEARAKIINFDPKQGLAVDLVNRFVNNNEPEKNLTLYCSILKNKNFDLVVEKCSELGINKIVPLISERTVKTGLKYNRLNKKIREAAEQCGRGVMPELAEKKNLKEAIDLASKQNKENIFYSLQAEGQRKNFEAKNLGVFIGPEGGWTKEEIEEFRNQEHFTKSSLGKLILRTETAAIVGVCLNIN
jgi:16S rRNA (uracil1498-N3)-methyltransferase